METVESRDAAGLRADFAVHDAEASERTDVPHSGGGCLPCSDAGAE
jgi:hypothetical protein